MLQKACYPGVVYQELENPEQNSKIKGQKSK
jgi:hypothetical protein